MNNEFFCVGCGRMLTISGDSVVFKTGFFRNKYSLGCCESCLKPNLSIDAEFEHEEERRECRPIPHTPVSGFQLTGQDPYRISVLV